VESAAISSEIEQLESELAGLRARVDDDNSSFASLEEQIASLKARLSETQEAVRSRETALEEKRAQLAEAQRLERLAAYEQDLAKYREARDRVEKAGDRFLAEAEAYDGEVLRIRKLRSEMVDAFGDDERTDEIDLALDEDANGLTTTWKAVVGAAEWRLRSVAKAAAAAAKPANGDDYGKEAAADEGRAARILEYFNKS
jgi:chromosome segregation ATPase